MKIQNLICKECRKEPRRYGSSRCRKCSDSYRDRQFQASRLQKKIEQAKNQSLTKIP